MCNYVTINMLQHTEKLRYVRVMCNYLIIIGTNKLTRFSKIQGRMRACVHTCARAHTRA